MEISKIIPKIRFRVGDTSEVVYSDFQIIEALNDAAVYFRKICVDKAPGLITEQKEGALAVGSYVIDMGSNPIKITDVRADGRKLHASVMSQVEDTKQNGHPQFYVPHFVGGSLKLYILPIPTSDIAYSIQYIDEIEEIVADTDLKYPRDIINAFVEFAVARLSKDDNAYAALGDRINTLVNDIAPSPCVVDPYY